jgi:hypothetical protein
MCLLGKVLSQRDLEFYGYNEPFSLAHMDYEARKCGRSLVIELSLRVNGTGAAVGPSAPSDSKLWRVV